MIVSCVFCVLGRRCRKCRYLLVVVCVPRLPLPANVSSAYRLPVNVSSTYRYRPMCIRRTVTGQYVFCVPCTGQCVFGVPFTGQCVFGTGPKEGPPAPSWFFVVCRVRVKSTVWCLVQYDPSERAEWDLQTGLVLAFPLSSPLSCLVLSGLV